MALKKYNDGKEAVISSWNKNGERRGFVSRDRDGLGYTRYGMGIDNMGDPYRGALDKELNLPVGKVDYGYDGDTVYGGFTPNIYGGKDEDSKWGGIGTINGNRIGYSKYSNGESNYFANLADMAARAGVRPNDNGSNSYYGLLALPDSARSFNAEGSFNTPLGTVNYSPVADAPGMYADFTPNARTSAYIQALANLLSGR